MNEWTKDDFLLSTDRSRLDRDRVHKFLSTEAYWCLEIPAATVDAAIRNSLCFGIYYQDSQVGFARVVTDHATFAWICDVYIETEFRGRGLAKWMVSIVTQELKALGLRRICLATKDAHSLYAREGFVAMSTPDRWMEIKRDPAYP